jgi:hypothetical protein
MTTTERPLSNFGHVWVNERIGDAGTCERCGCLAVSSEAKQKCAGIRTDQVIGDG